MDALSAFSRLINTSHKKVFDGVFDTLQTGLSKLGDSSNSQTKAISDLLHLIKDIPMDGKQDYDVLGFIYEYLIESVRDDYDYILVDCSPNLGQLTLNALVAADEVIIPVQAAYLPIKGLEQLLKTISRVKRKMNPKLHIMGILITMVDYRTIYAKEITEVLYEHYGSSIHIFDDVIPLSVRAAEASAEGVSIYKYDGKGKVAAAYEKIVEEVLANEQ